jgi:hypothetical protein
VQKNNSADPTILKMALEGIGEVETVVGTIYFGGRETYEIDHQIIHPWYICTIKDGKEKLVKQIRLK